MNAMEYKVTHTTVYSYSVPVSVCHNVLVLMPRNSDRLRRESHRLVIRPIPIITTRRDDFYGNHSHRFSIQESHRSLTVTSTSKVRVQPCRKISNGDAVGWEMVRDQTQNRIDPNWLAAAPFRFPSPRVPIGDSYADFAKSAFTRDEGIIDGLMALTAKIHSEFAYDPNATQVDTPVGEAFEHRHGVCQDFAHVQLACLRSLGIPARYVSGYLRTIPPEGGTRMVGADQSHAWVSAYCGEKLGWQEFDPTNNCRGSSNHIPVAWGRDYGDVVPVRGVFLGGGTHKLSVSVKVENLNQVETVNQ